MLFGIRARIGAAGDRAKKLRAKFHDREAGEVLSNVGDKLGRGVGVLVQGRVLEFSTKWAGKPTCFE